MNRHVYFYTILLATVITVPQVHADSKKPLKVYILAGQSNMEGHARINTFDYIGRDPETAPVLKEMLGPDGKPKVCRNVWISSYTGMKEPSEGFGKLTAGYGARGNPKKPGDKIGPEFTFGIYMQKILDEPILLIKTAWGGKSLNTDFRPPGAGPYEWRPEAIEDFRKHGRDIEKIKAEKAELTGLYYRLMINHVKHVLKDIKRVCPVYDEEAGYELAGFVWFQGWNDMCDGWTYGNDDRPGKYDKYTELLAQLIRDVRKDLDAPDMRFVIGVIGVHGDNAKGAIARLRPAMAAPASMEEFKGNVIAVQTKDFWDYAMEEARPRQIKMWQAIDSAHEVGKDGKIVYNPDNRPGWEPIGTPKMEDRRWRYFSFDPPEKEKRKIGEHRFRDVTLPDSMKGWYKPGFDDGDWSRGKAPIGTGEWKFHNKTVRNNSDWGDGEFLLMRTTFNVEKLKWVEYRISVLARQGFDVYLNGHKIHTYIWWKKIPYYRAIKPGENHVKLLRKGENLLAVYANVEYDKKTGKPYASIDIDIEGLTETGKAAVHKRLDAICSPADRKILEGCSNAEYHYMGSAKIMAQIGKAFAEAMAG